MKTILLTQNQVTIVSDEDFDWLSEFNWCVSTRPSLRTFYVIRHRPYSEITVSHKSGSIQMHRAIAERMGLDLTNHIDHVDGDGLNNQRENLRSATPQQNQHNRSRKPKGCSSEYKGVSWFKITQKWRAYININSKQISLGYFTDEIEAALAYNKAAIKFYGEFASLNKIGYLDVEFSDLTPIYNPQQCGQNQHRKPKGCSSEYKGVCLYKSNKKWKAGITINSVETHLGYFTKEHDAARAYNEAATKLYGEFAALNIILEQQIN